MLITYLKQFSSINYSCDSCYLGEDHVDIAFLNHCLGEACLKLNYKTEAREYLNKANDTYKYLPGKSHPFYTNDFLPLFEQL